MSKKYYAFEFIGGNHSCTIGTANEITGRYSIAGNIKVLSSKKERDHFVYMAVDAVSCTKKELRSYCLGISVENFEMEIDCATDLND